MLGSVTLQAEAAREGISAEASEEIEAIRAIYGEDVAVQSGEELGLNCPVCISIACKPNTGGNAAQMFVQADVCICLSVEYPAIAPDVIITRSSGIGEEGERDVLQQLHDSILSNTYGETCVYQIIYSVMEQLEAKNSCGECGVCFEPLLPENCTQPEQIAVRSDCFHVFHIECLAKWFAVRRTLFKTAAPAVPNQSRSRALQMKLNEKKRAMDQAEATLRVHQTAFDQAREELVRFQSGIDPPSDTDGLTSVRLHNNIKKWQKRHSESLQLAQKLKTQYAAQDAELQECIARELEHQEAKDESDHYCPICRTNLHLQTFGEPFHSCYHRALQLESEMAKAAATDAGAEQQEVAPTATLDSAALPSWLIARVRETQQWQQATWSRLKANS